MSVNEKLVVQKRNILNELRSNKMTIQELRFFSIYLAKINTYDLSTRKVRIPLEDYRRIMGFGRINVNQLRESTDRLLCKIIHLFKDDGIGYTSFQLFSECEIDRDGNNKYYIEFNAHDKALPLLFDFKNKYFKYELWNALRLKSPNQIRMYEILKQYEKIGQREITVERLKELIGVDEKEYGNRWDNFKKRVIDSCQQALKENTDICYTYERGQTGRGGKWISIIFYIYKNDSYKNPLSLEEFIEQQPVIEIEPTSKSQEPIKTNSVDVVDLCKDEDNDKKNNGAGNNSSFTEQDYEGELAKILADCSDYIYSPAQITVLQDMITEIAGQDCQKCKSYFIHQINVMNLYEEKKRKKGEKIESRFAYLYKMIEQDLSKEIHERKKVKKEQQEQNSSFDLEDLDDLAMFDD